MTTADSPPLFDRLRYVDRLTSAGIAENQARAHADAMEDALRSGVATKADVGYVRSEIAAPVSYTHLTLPTILLV